MPTGAVAVLVALVLVAAAARADQQEAAPAPSGERGGSAVKLGRTGLALTLPRRWKERVVPGDDPPPGVVRRAFIREGLRNGAAKPPALMLIAEPVPPSTDIVKYSAIKREGAPPHKVLNLFSHLDGTITLKYAIGYRIRGDGPAARSEVHLVHALAGGYGFVILLESQQEDHEAIKGEIAGILRSLRAR